MNKRLFKSAIALVSACAVIAMLFSFNSFAAGTIISFSKNSVTVGENVTVTVKISENEMYGSDLTIVYDNNILTYSSGPATGGAGVLKIVDQDMSGESSKSYSLVFIAAKAGSCTISVSGTVGSGIPAVDKTMPGASAKLSVVDKALSANANLKSLSVSAGSLSPRFSANTTLYTVNVKKSVTDCRIYAQAAESGAKVEVSGSSALKIGENKRTVTVTAPSGAQKIYNITIIRSNEDDTSSTDGTSSENSETQENPLETTIGNDSYRVIADISGVTLPKGFEIRNKEYNGQQISVAADKKNNYELYYLKASNSDNIVPYTYDEATKTFKRIKIFSQGENQYILVDISEDFATPEELYKTSTTIGGNEIKCYAPNVEELAGMYYVYCYFDGKHGLYRYDSVENVLQRSPDIKLLTVEEAAAIAPEGKAFAYKFSKLSTNAKTILVCLIIAVLGVIALIVLLVIRYINLRKFNGFDDLQPAMEFESVEFNDDFIIGAKEEEKIAKNQK